MEARTKKSNTREMRIQVSETECFLKLTTRVLLSKTESFHDFVAEFFNDWIGQDFLVLLFFVRASISVA